MIPFSVKALCAAVNGTMLQATDAAITGVSTDSRTVAAGQLFIPLVGEKFDGHAYLNSALEKGAEGCLCMHAPDTMMPGKFYIQVADTLLALKALASWYRSQFNIPMVEISGSAGKTTTKEMIASVLSQHYPTLKTEANYNNFIGTPQTLLRLEQSHRAAVIETGLDHFGDLIYMGEMVRPTVAVLTNIGDAHIENLGNTREGTLRAKSEIFENLQPGGLAVLCGDDALLNTLNLPFTTLRCGKSENCNVRVTDIVDHGIEGIECTVTTEKDTYHLSIPSPGEYMIYSASMAVAIGEHLGLTKDEIIGGVAAYQSTGSRMRRIRLSDNRIVIDDCYNANPQAMEAALKILANTDRARRVAVVGDMGELGAVSESAHKRVGELTNQLGLTAVVAVGPKCAAVAETAQGEVYHFDTVEEALPTIKKLLSADTAMLVKASHAMEFGKIVKELEQL